MTAWQNGMLPLVRATASGRSRLMILPVRC
nr:MAG TPA: RNA polymerase subunit [Caudoviricetes sp.]